VGGPHVSMRVKFSFLGILMWVLPALGILVLGSVLWDQYEKYRALENWAENHRSDPAALIQVARSGDIETASKLLILGADVNSQDPLRKDTALIAAAAAKNGESMARFLLSKGADVNHQNSSGVTALAVAAEEGNADLVTLLLEAGADFRFKDRNGATALSRAVLGFAENTSPHQDYPGTVKILLEEYSKNSEDRSQMLGRLKSLLLTFIDSPARIEKTKILELILRSGVDPNVKDSEGNSALLLAVSRNDLASINVLIDHGSRLDDRDIHGATAFERARQLGFDDIQRKIAEASGQL
jgi:uncharacterized protein